MSRQPHTKSCSSSAKVGFVESDTALRLWPALQVLPARSPSMCNQKIGLPELRAAALASSSELCQVIARKRSVTLASTSLDRAAMPLLGAGEPFAWAGSGTRTADPATTNASATAALMTDLLDRAPGPGAGKQEKQAPARRQLPASEGTPAGRPRLRRDHERVARLAQHRGALPHHPAHLDRPVQQRRIQVRRDRERDRQRRTAVVETGRQEDQRRRQE